MSFFQKNSDIKLSDYENVKTRFCFLDESGSLSDIKDPFFTVGFIRCSQPYYIGSKIAYERGKRNFYDEMKFNKLSKLTLILRNLLLILFSQLEIYILVRTLSTNMADISTESLVVIRGRLMKIYLLEF